MSVTCLTSRTAASSTPRARHGLSLPWTLTGGPLPNTQGTHCPTVGNKRLPLSQEEEDLPNPCPKTQGSHSSTKLSEASSSTPLSHPSPSPSSVIHAAFSRTLEKRALLTSVPTIGRDLCLQTQRQMLESLGSLLAGMFNTLDLRTRVYRLLHLKHCLLLYLIHNEPHALGKKDLLDCCRHMFCFDCHKMVSFVERTVFDNCLGLELFYVIHLIVSEFLEEVVRQDPSRGMDFIVGILDESGEAILFKERAKMFSRESRNMSPQQQAEAISSLCMLAPAPLKGMLEELFSLPSSPETSILLCRGGILLEASRSASCELAADLHPLFQSFGSNQDERPMIEEGDNENESAGSIDLVEGCFQQSKSHMTPDESLSTGLTVVDAVDSLTTEQAGRGESATAELAATSHIDRGLVPTLSAQELMSTSLPSYKIKFILDGFRVDEVTWPKSEPLTRAKLSELLVLNANELADRKLSFAWIDEFYGEILLKSDSEVRDAVRDQTRYGKSTLSFHVRIGKKRLREEKQTTAFGEQSDVALPSLATAIPPNPNTPALIPTHTHTHASPSPSMTFALTPSERDSSLASENTRGSTSNGPSFDWQSSLEKVKTGWISMEASLEEKIGRILAIQNEILHAFRAHSEENHEQEEQDEEDEITAAVSNTAIDESSLDHSMIIHRYCAEAKQKDISPLFLAAEAGDVEGVQALLTCTHDAVEYENESQVVKNFMQEPVEDRINKAERKEGRRSPLNVAAENGHARVVSLLIEHKAILDAKFGPNQCTSLHIAAYNGHTDTVSILLRHRADIAAKEIGSCTALHYAAENGQIAAAEALVAAGADKNAINSCGRTPVHVATTYGHSKIVSFLIAKNANVNARDNEERTPLHLAAVYGHVSTVNALVGTHKAEMDAKDFKGLTPLYCAAEKGNTEIVKVFIAHGVNVEAIDENGHNTPLHIAAFKGHASTVEALLRHGADIEARNKKHRTPLHLGALSGSEETVQVLLAHGANVLAENKEYRMPIHLSKNKGVEALLRNAMKNRRLPTETS